MFHILILIFRTGVAVLFGLYACAAEEQELFSLNKYFNINSYSPLFLFLHIGMRVRSIHNMSLVWKYSLNLERTSSQLFSEAAKKFDCSKTVGQNFPRSCCNVFGGRVLRHFGSDRRMLMGCFRRQNL